MKYSLHKIFELIDEEKTENDFYYNLSRGGYGLDYYFNLITSYTPKEKIIINADCNKKKMDTSHIISEELDIDDILFYEYIGHNENYSISRLGSLDEAIKIMLGKLGLSDMFTGDIVVIENGKRKKYKVKDTNGNILHWEDIDKINKQKIKMFIDWC
jgi:hypothetical protein